MIMAALARWLYGHRRIVLAAWLGALVGFPFASRAIGSDYKDSFSLPNTDSQAAYDLLAKSFPQQSGESDTIVWKATTGTFNGRGNEIATANVQSVVSTAQAAADPTLQVELGGQTIARAVQANGAGN